jgi:hypothetical protein
MSEIEAIARRLADALQDFAYTRKDEDKKRVIACEVELIQFIKNENNQK